MGLKPLHCGGILSVHNTLSTTLKTFSTFCWLSKFKLKSKFVITCLYRSFSFFLLLMTLMKECFEHFVSSFIQSSCDLMCTMRGFLERLLLSVFSLLFSHDITTDFSVFIPAANLCKQINLDFLHVVV